MPAQRAILADIARLGLNPKDKHTSLNKNGNLVTKKVETVTKNSTQKQQKKLGLVSLQPSKEDVEHTVQTVEEKLESIQAADSKLVENKVEIVEVSKEQESNPVIEQQAEINQVQNSLNEMLYNNEIIEEKKEPELEESKVNEKKKKAGYFNKSIKNNS